LVVSRPQQFGTKRAGAIYTQFIPATRDAALRASDAERGSGLRRLWNVLICRLTPSKPSQAPTRLRWVYAAKDVTASRSELGLRTDKSYAMQDAVLTLRGRLAWAHDFNPDRSIAATFQTLPGASFVVNGAAQASDSALTTASAEVKWLNGWSAAATFEGEFSDVSRSYAGKGVVRYIW
jgi:hypothetical protein